MQHVADLLALRQMHLILTDALDRIALVDELRHPEARYCIADTVAALRAELVSVDGEAERIRNSPTVLEAA